MQDSRALLENLPANYLAQVQRASSVHDAANPWQQWLHSYHPEGATLWRQTPLRILDKLTADLIEGGKTYPVASDRWEQPVQALRCLFSVLLGPSRTSETAAVPASEALQVALATSLWQHAWQHHWFKYQLNNNPGALPGHSSFRSTASPLHSLLDTLEHSAKLGLGLQAEVGTQEALARTLAGHCALAWQQTESRLQPRDACWRKPASQSYPQALQDWAWGWASHLLGCTSHTFLQPDPGQRYHMHQPLAKVWSYARAFLDALPSDCLPQIAQALDRLNRASQQQIEGSIPAFGPLQQHIQMRLQVHTAVRGMQPLMEQARPAPAAPTRSRTHRR